MACTMAVSAATKMPAGVRDFRDQALWTSAAVAGTAMNGCIALQLATLGRYERKVQRARQGQQAV